MRPKTNTDIELKRNGNSERSRTEIEEAARFIVMRWLELHGYSGDSEMKIGGETMSIVRGSGKDLLICIRSSVLPDKPPSLTDAERKELASRALDLGLTAFVATVEMDNSLRLVDSIRVQLVV